MAIPVACECGWNMPVLDELAGTLINCPMCGVEILIRQPAAGATTEAPLSSTDQSIPIKDRIAAIPPEQGQDRAFTEPRERSFGLVSNVEEPKMRRDLSPAGWCAIFAAIIAGYFT